MRDLLVQSLIASSSEIALRSSASGPGSDDPAIIHRTTTPNVAASVVASQIRFDRFRTLRGLLQLPPWIGSVHRGDFQSTAAWDTPAPTSSGFHGERGPSGGAICAPIAWI